MCSCRGLSLVLVLAMLLLMHNQGVAGVAARKRDKGDLSAQGSTARWRRKVHKAPSRQGESAKTDTSSVRELDLPQNQSPRSKIMFWRPQKVGSSTLVNIFNTYSFRHDLTISPKGSKNSLCYFIHKCANELGLEVESTMNPSGQHYRLKPIDSRDVSRHADISIQHQLCNMDGAATQKALPCAFRSNDDLSVPIKQVTLVREPLSRAISVYYFWGELFKLKESKRSQSKSSRSTAIGAAFTGNHTITSGKFDYHGDENTPPPTKIARDFVSDFSRVYTKGMPGPSFSWSSFSNSAKDAANRLLPASSTSWAPQVLPLVLERMDESLVLMCDYLGWRLADAVFIKPRKHLSSHPKAAAWDQVAVTELTRKLTASGEVMFYNKSQEALDAHIRLYNERHYNYNAAVISGAVADHHSTPFESHTALYKALKTRAGEVCQLDSEVVADYQTFLSGHETVRPCPTVNKLRDVDASYIENGHCFILHASSKLFTLSIDICGSCEAQAMAYAVEHGVASTVAEAPLYKQLKPTLSAEVQNTLFTNCP